MNLLAPSLDLLQKKVVFEETLWPFHMGTSALHEMALTSLLYHIKCISNVFF